MVAISTCFIPKALNFKKFSPPCDVWSYGIVMYEIWSLGSKPYKNIKNMEVSSYSFGVKFNYWVSCVMQMLDDRFYRK